MRAKKMKLTADLRDATIPYPTLTPKANPDAQELQLRNAWMGKMVQ